MGSEMLQVTIDETGDKMTIIRNNVIGVATRASDGVPCMFMSNGNFLACPYNTINDLFNIFAPNSNMVFCEVTPDPTLNGMYSKISIMIYFINNFQTCPISGNTLITIGNSTISVLESYDYIYNIVAKGFSIEPKTEASVQKKSTTPVKFFDSPKSIIQKIKEPENAIDEVCQTCTIS